ncbi:MAG: hypothetical protein N2484_18550 [Clostridia bacterium]|nr:hypothetical protein [Clostridia bacterium]
MVSTILPAKTKNYVMELMRRKVISESSLLDQMFINYLCNLKIDEDYFHIQNDVNLDEIQRHC